MKKIVALMRKEYLETRFLTLAFLGVGVGLQTMSLLFYGFRTDQNSLCVIVNAAVFVVILNLTTLFATAFAREREKGAMTILRRLVPNWRVAAVAKFGYALLSALVLALFFYGEFLFLDLLFGLPFHTIVRSLFQSEVGFVSRRFIAFYGFVYAPCWGVFWSGRTARQTTAIALAFISEVCVSVPVYWLFDLFSNSANPRSYDLSMTICAVLLLGVNLGVLCLAPVRNRFGYVE